MYRMYVVDTIEDADQAAGDSIEMRITAILLPLAPGKGKADFLAVMLLILLIYIFNEGL